MRFGGMPVLTQETLRNRALTNSAIQFDPQIRQRLMEPGKLRDPNARLLPPMSEVLPDGTALVRYFAPNAQRVALRNLFEEIPMERDADGVWTASLPAGSVGLRPVMISVDGTNGAFGVKKVMRFFPPIVTGPIIIAIGLTLSGSAIQNCTQNWWIALLAILIIIVCNIWGKGMIKIIPILLGVLGSYIVATCFGFPINGQGETPKRVQDISLV